MAAIRSRRGASFALLSEIGGKRFRYGISTALYLEYQSKLLESVEGGATPLDETQIHAILAALAHFAEPVPIFFRLRPNLRDEGDNFVFECAAHFGANYIITHNIRDFISPQVRGYKVQPVTPGEFLKMLQEENQ
ncbi:MAG: PIN domain-containing protein [Abitibacteriaceae bacterium]|nr:PIN domain-containing protein [Abditibacteriaceae bacterium]